jgi:Skp family chaperone for outer membrane proteins
VVILGVAVFIGAQLWGQSTGAPQGQAPAQVRVALVNLVAVLQNYDKAKLFQSEMKKELEKYEKEEKDLREGISKAQKILEKQDLEKKLRDEWENYLTSCRRAREDLIAKMNKELAGKGNDQAVQLYREVEEAVADYARSNGFHVVLQFNDTINAAEKYQPAYLQRKLERPGGACLPMYMAPGLDISLGVAANLNQRYAAQGGARPVIPAGGVVPGKGPKN